MTRELNFIIVYQKIEPVIGFKTSLRACNVNVRHLVD